MSGGGGPIAAALVTGAGGQLGRALVASAPAGIRLTALGSTELDIRDAAAVSEKLGRLRPDVVFNAAAYTAVDKAESEPELADALNHRAVAGLADACTQTGARLVHVSTDYVFDGISGAPYEPDARTNPLSVYGRTKRDGEAAALASPGALVVRTAWVYAPGGRNFVATMLRLMSTRPEVRVVDDQIGSPTTAEGLAGALWALAARGASGIHHWTDAGVASWYDFAVAIREEAEALGFDRVAAARVIPIRSSEFPTPARRPGVAILAKERTWRELGTTGEHWRDGLRRTIRRMTPGPGEVWRTE